MALSEKIGDASLCLRPPRRYLVNGPDPALSNGKENLRPLLLTIGSRLLPG
jgi:hypothetical protein